MVNRLYNIARGSSELKDRASIRGPRYLLPCVALVMFFHRAPCVSAQDLSVVGTPQQANERIRTLSATSKSPPHEYTIGNGDLLSISVFDVPELTREVRVSQSGTISIPLVPARLHVAGLTEIQAEQTIADVLEANGLVSHPEVGVTVKEHRSRPITLVGAAHHPMADQAGFPVDTLDALGEAGGISNDAGDTIIVTRSRAAAFIPVPNPEPTAESAPGVAPPALDATPAPTVPDEQEKSSNAIPPVFPSATQVAQTPSGTPDASGKTQTPTPSGNIIS